MASIGQVFGKYELRTRIASTNLGEVWAVREQGAGMLAQDVALKILNPQVCADATFVKLYLDEARRAAPLTHQHIAQTLDLVQHDGAYGLVTELVPGETLKAVLEKAREQRTAIPVRLATTLAFHAAQALHATHTRADNLGRPLQLVHKGVTPNNMIVGFGGILKVTDVGTAWVVTQVGSLRASTGPGKYRYMSPEQCLNTPLDLRTDIFSLGVVLWELLAGKRLHDGDDEFAIKQAVSLTQPAPLPDLRSDVSGALNQAVARALAKNPADRWEGAQAFVEALESALQPLGGPMQPSEVANFMAQLFPQRHAWWGKVLGQTGGAAAAAPAAGANLTVDDAARDAGLVLSDDELGLGDDGLGFDDDDDDLGFGDSDDEFNVEATLTDFKMPVGFDPGDQEPAVAPSKVRQVKSDESQPPTAAKGAAGGFGLTVPAPQPEAKNTKPPEPPARAPTTAPPRFDESGTIDEPMPQRSAPRAAPAVTTSATSVSAPLTDLVEAPVDVGAAPTGRPPAVAAKGLPAAPLKLVPDGYEPDPYIEDPYVEPRLVPDFRLTDVVAESPSKSRTALGQPATEVLQHRDGSALSSYSLRAKSKPFKAPLTDLTVAMAAGGVTTVTVGAGLSGTIKRTDGSTETIQPGTTLLLRDGDRAELDTGSESWIVRVFRPPLRPRGLELNLSLHEVSIAMMLAAMFVLLVGIAVNEAEKKGIIVKVEKPQKEKFADARIRKIKSLKPKKKKVVRIKRIKPKKKRKAPKKVAKNKVAPKPVPKLVVKPPDPTEAKPKITNKQREKIAKLSKDKYAGKTKKEKLTKMFETPSKGSATNFKAATSSVQSVKAKSNSGAFRVAGDPTFAKGDEVRLAVGAGTGGGPVTKGGPAATGNVPKLAARAKPKKVRGKVSGLRAAARVSGSLSRGEVLKVIGKHMGRIRRCYERQLMANPRLAGKLTAQWSVTASGRVSGARQRTSTLGNGKVSSCVLKVIRGMKFPKPKGGAVKITYPFIFRSVS